MAILLKSSERSHNRVALMALFVGAIAIGSSPILVRISELEPTATAFWRVALATPIFFLISQWGEAFGDRGKALASIPELA